MKFNFKLMVLNSIKLSCRLKLHGGVGWWGDSLELMCHKDSINFEVNMPAFSYNNCLPSM